MNPLLWLAEHWQKQGQGGLRRRILLEIVGLEPAAIDRYLGEGLLHNLALLSDIGQRARLDGSVATEIATLRATANQRGVRVIELTTALESGDSQLSTICRDDELRQTRLFEQLDRRPAGELIICSFDMPARLRRLFGSNPSESEQLVLRDTYARMDEVVGKAFSFIDDSMALAIAVAPDQDCHSECDTPRFASLFMSRGLHSFAESPCMLHAALFPDSTFASASN
jgi:hypothetical protein